MAGENPVTLVGNLTADPEIKWTQSGACVVNFTVASTPRFFDKQAGEWRDGEALFMRCTAWRQLAEHVAESLTKGARVITQGRLRQRAFETKEGEKRTVVEMEADEVGPALRYATAKVTKAQRCATPPPRSPRPSAALRHRQGHQGPALRYATAKVTKAQRSAGGAAASAQHDPWAAPAPAAGTDDPPF